MLHFPSWFRYFLVGIATVAIVTWFWLALGPAGSFQAQEPPKQKPNGPTKFFFGKSSCAMECHGYPLDKPYVDKKLPAVCRCTELTLWDAQDKHAIAHKVLSGGRAKRMGELLHIKDVASAKQCVICHGVWIEKEDEKKVDTSAEEIRKEGVTCVVCHGAYQDWVEKHHGSRLIKLREKWRALDRPTKEVQFGMTDLWDPVKRTRLCASCHIGNVAEGKVVTHDMYAAGHPPLPGFEIVAFSNQMPRHWEYLKEKKKEVAALYHFNPLEIQQEETHLTAIGGLVAFQEAMKLLAAQAERDWPELAQFDCYACHHELKPKSWRQERGYAGKPGRPPMRPWPQALVELGLFHAAAADEAANILTGEFKTKLRKVQDAFDRQPFGDSAAVKKTALEMAAWTQTQIELIQKNIRDNKYGELTSERLLSRLLDWKGKTLPDFDSARQLAWAFAALHREARPVGHKALLESPAWKSFDSYLGLNFPPGQVWIEKSLDKGLERIGNYEPAKYHQLFNDLVKKPPVPK